MRHTENKKFQLEYIPIHFLSNHNNTIKNRSREIKILWWFTKIRQFQFSYFTDEKILRLQISVNPPQKK